MKVGQINDQPFLTCNLQRIKIGSLLFTKLNLSNYFRLFLINSIALLNASSANALLYLGLLGFAKA